MEEIIEKEKTGTTKMKGGSGRTHTDAAGPKPEPSSQPR